MENTLSVYVESLNETWEMPDELAIKLNEFEKENPIATTNADKVHEAWLATLSPDDMQKISRNKPQA